ncbi:GNAT family N-acetyltransferase [Govanella unica]|uniref:GNAT family N-acetyltransferase n=1 Tax=Govanella unica TaxID=2975056 RepID=A0A9X3TW06_9PROT|nr:GNAT family N-acetyltransferase [Govania unica]MDA5192698.1 GNAT family N-acetyltransferase [Govania unica]
MILRLMQIGDMEIVGRLCNDIHRAHPERPEVLRERLALYPSGCLVIETSAGQIVGYAISHPSEFGKPPALDSFLGSLPAQPSTYYIHDVALLPETRGQGHAAAILDHLTSEARKAGLPNLSLVAIAGADRYWARQGFTPYSTPELAEKLKSYGEDACFMQRVVD